MKSKLFLTLLLTILMAEKNFCQTGTWENYTTANSGLPDNIVKCVYVARDSSIWIGTGSGLAHFKNGTWQTFNTGNSQLPDNEVICIHEGLTGNYIWVGTLSGGLCKYDGSNWTIFDKSNSQIPDNYILCIEPELNLASEEIVWV